MHCRLLFLALVSAILLAGCAGPSLTPQERAALEGPARGLEARGQWREAALAWQQSADAASGDIAVELRLNAADALLQAGDGQGGAALARALPESLPPDLNLRRVLVLADASLLGGDAADALRRLGPGVSSEDRALLSRYRRARSDALEASGDLLGAARERALRDALLASPTDAYRNRQDIWSLLTQVPSEVLDAQPLTPPQAESGWIELASLARRHTFEPEALDAGVAAWIQRYPGHAAGEQLVPELLERARADAQPPTKVALLLPQSGPFADAAAAVRDGFMAAWFTDAPNPHRPEIVVRDSAERVDVVQAYASALADGAQFVVGPLSKEAVNTLILEATLSVTTLMLNYPSIDPATTMASGTSAPAGADPALIAPATGAAAPATIDASAAPVPPLAPGAAGEAAAPVRDLTRVYHFALAPEDEARRAAEHAWARGARQAGVLAPEGEWGSRVGAAFAARWRELGGTLAGSADFPNDVTRYSATVEQLLNIDQSNQRARALRALLVRDIKHEPQPRSDLDVIFLAAFPQDARQLKPMLLFHGAGHVPVLATSHVFGGTPDPQRDQDLDGVTFGDMPWILAGDAFALPASVRSVWSGTDGALGRLYAFGADAYALIARLRDLRASSTATHPGFTGALSLDAQHHLRRDLDWAVIRDGLPQRIAIAPGAGAPAAPWGLVLQR
jgi:outer membrane PBP1 activator LpoA protein